MPDFAFPFAFLALPLALLGRLLPPDRGTRSGAVYVPPSIAARLPATGDSEMGKRLFLLLPVMLWLLLVTALAGPRIPVETNALPISGRDIVLVLDLSGSMATTDFQFEGKAVSRLDAVKRVASRFVEGRAGDRIGLVIFAEKAYFAAPLTYDVRALAATIRGATIGISGRSTAIANGLGLALKRLERSAAKSRVIILLSDGTDTSGSVPPTEVGRLAKRLGVRIDTIALGTQDLTTTADGRDAVDTRTLKSIAEGSGRTAFRVRTFDDLQKVAASIDRLEPTVSGKPPMMAWRDLWIWPAGAALCLALVLLGWRERAA